MVESISTITSSTASDAMLSDSDCGWELLSDLDSVVSLESTTSSINNAAQHPTFYANIFVRTSIPYQEKQTTGNIHSTQPSHKARTTTYLDALLRNIIPFQDKPEPKTPLHVKNHSHKIHQDSLGNALDDTSFLEAPCSSPATFKGHRQSHTMRRIPFWDNDNRRYVDKVSRNERMMDKDLWWRTRAARAENHRLRRQDKHVARQARLKSARTMFDEK